MRKIYTYYDGSSLPVHDFMNNTDVKIKKKFLFCLDFIKGGCGHFFGLKIPSKCPSLGLIKL